MPKRPPKLIRPGQQTERQRKRAIDRRRGSSARRGYDAAWRKARAAHLAIEPLCRFHREQGQIVEATVVDHIISIEDRPDLRLEHSNLRSLCKPCHDERTAREQGFNRGKRTKAKGGCDAIGIPSDPGHHWNS